MITVVTPALPYANLPPPKVGEAFTLNFNLSGTYHSLVIEDNLVLILKAAHDSGWHSGEIRTLDGTWFHHSAQNRRIYTQVEITLKP